MFEYQRADGGALGLGTLLDAGRVTPRRKKARVRYSVRDGGRERSDLGMSILSIAFGQEPPWMTGHRCGQPVEAPRSEDSRPGGQGGENVS
jgi:hypothetical protein